MTTQVQPRLIGAKDAAAYLGISIWTIRKAAYQSRIATCKIGARLMFSLEDLDDLIAASRRPAIAQNAASQHERA